MVLYGEAVRMPLIVSWPGHTMPGRVDDTHLVSMGLDLLPTFCDFAGAKMPAKLTGRSIRPWTERSAMVPANAERRFVVTEVNYTRGRPFREDWLKKLQKAGLQGEPELVYPGRKAPCHQ